MALVFIQNLLFFFPRGVDWAESYVSSSLRVFKAWLIRFEKFLRNAHGNGFKQLRVSAGVLRGRKSHGLALGKSIPNMIDK
jgi:hypothetical protein